MRVVASALLASVLGCAGALAQSGDTVQSSDDIVRFFSGAADLGATRGICVGTEEECSKKADAPVKTGLDMMINFDLNSAAITPNAQNKLNEFAEALKDTRLQSHSFTVEGYTDARGPEGYNMSLSEKRARSVAAFLLENGVEPSRINAEGKGEESPRVADAFDPVNRRVELRINLQ
jgi:outer membrane protein OmpA-like peptidoglycan-associated protein